jgi:isopenicillin-N N-acyltransferase like protein
MMRKRNRWWKWLLYPAAAILLLLVSLAVYLYCVATVDPPEISNVSCISLQRKKLGEHCYVIGNNWIRKSKGGLWEMYVEGNGFERGVINGKLAKELIYTQESAFNEQISEIVPSKFYRHFLKYFIGWFNRDLEKNISDEYKQEIYGVSLAASSEFDYVGSAYQRFMNYHAAHDIGHALQNMAMVGCTSFGTWNTMSADSNLIIGRNFDFYVGDKFAEEKIVMFYKPDKGYRFMTVTWGGMIGVVSGMNMEGITVTLNAAKSTIPSGSATPVSLLARQVLQYARNIEEAVAIIRKGKTFVSESFMIGSRSDNKAVIVEKTPGSCDVYTTSNDHIICTNHYQSAQLRNQKENLEQMDQSASVYRSQHLSDLLKGIHNTPEKTASILRDQVGMKGKFIGYGNEKAINQLICHHSVIFEPGANRVWVSTAPWQLGAYVAYDLADIFAMNGLKSDMEVADSIRTIAPDTFLKSNAYASFVKFRALKEKLRKQQNINVTELIQSNPEYYHTYVLAGDYLFRQSEYVKAKTFYTEALTKEIATKTEEKYIKEQLHKCDGKIKERSH